MDIKQQDQHLKKIIITFFYDSRITFNIQLCSITITDTLKEICRFKSKL